MKWIVELLGDDSDLAALAQSLSGEEVNLSHDGQSYVLTSKSFQPSDEAGTIRENAEHLVELLNGASRLALEATQSIRAGSVYRIRADGKRDIFLFAEPGAVRLRAISPTLTLTHVDGSVEQFRPADPVAKWLQLAHSNGSVAKTLRIMATGALDWVNLYRVLEIIEDDIGGTDGMVSHGWATRRAIRLFKHTANSPGALGLDARHGAASTEPPQKPMVISEARSLINSIVQAWLRSKTADS